MIRKKGKPPAEFVSIPLYGPRVYFVWDRKTWKKLHRWLEAPAEACDPGGSSGMTSIGQDPRDSMPTICVGVFDGAVDTLAHECAHAAFCTFELVGIDARSDMGEAFCYLLGWLVSAGGDALTKGKT